MKMQSLSISLFLLILVMLTTCTESIQESGPHSNFLPQTLNTDALIEYINTHRKELEEISRQEVGRQDILIQKQIHLVLTPEKRYSLWIDKIDELIDQKSTNAEKDHLSKFKSALSIDLFRPDIEKLNQFQAFAEVWQEEAIVNLGWSAEDIKYIGMSYSLNNSEIIVKEEQSDRVSFRVAPEIPPCNCSTKSTWWCDPDPCVSTLLNCKWSNPGCGTLLMYACDGWCKNS